MSIARQKNTDAVFGESCKMYVYTATVLWYFEVLLIGIILPQFEGRFKHFLLVIRIIHTSRRLVTFQIQIFKFKTNFCV